MNITSNGTYTAPEGKAYSPVNVNVPTVFNWNAIAKNEWPTGDVVITEGTTIEKSAFSQKKLLTSVYSNTITTLKDSVFSYCTSLQKVVLPACTNTINVNTQSQFYGAGASNSELHIPNFNSGIPGNFAADSHFTIVDIGKATTISARGFITGKVNTLIIRKSDGICSLGNLNALQGTPFASDGTGGTLYVPNSLISAYQSATNWSTILGYANNSIVKLEGSPYETPVTTI